MAKNIKTDVSDIETGTETTEQPKAPAANYAPRTPKLNARIETWKEQKRVRCCHKESSGFAGTCYYPLNVTLDKDHRPVIIQTEDGPAALAECSWDPKHKRINGSQQFVLLADLKAAEEK